jgi:hypothetical protein
MMIYKQKKKSPKLPRLKKEKKDFLNLQELMLSKNS